jgi:hypothetical protein
VKGLRVLIEALLAARRTDVRLTIVGDGEERATLEAMAAPLGEVRFTGYQSQEEVAGILATAHAFVLPSFAEGVPVVLMEALAAGLPVIATRITGVPELVETGFRVFCAAGRRAGAGRRDRPARGAARPGGGDGGRGPREGRVGVRHRHGGRAPGGTFRECGRRWRAARAADTVGSGR